MKNIMILFTVFCFCFGSIQAQKAMNAPKTAKVVIHTNAICGQCKTTIETALDKLKGVKTASLDVATKDATVVYFPKKLEVVAIRKAISMAGYNADELNANQEAHDNLPTCCRMGHQQ